MDNKRYNDICSYLKKVTDGTEWTNHVFVVGGCVRDEVMKRPIKDVDLAVDLLNGGIRFSMWLYEKGLTTREPVTYPTYSTAMFHLKEFPNDELEAVQTRKETYEDKTNRNPTTAYGTIKEDCMRRDLTINALYKNITSGEILDMTERGLDDIKNHIIRTPLDADITFDDDPLRMLRCIRFATRYGWAIEKTTLEAIHRNHKRLEIITAERIKDEITKIFSVGENSAQALQYIIDTKLEEIIFGVSCALFVPFENIEGYGKAVTALRKMKSDNYLANLAIILIAIGDSEYDDVYTFCKKLKFSNDELNKIWKYIKFQKFILNQPYVTLYDKAKLRELMHRIGDYDDMKTILLIEKAFNSPFEEVDNDVMRDVDHILSTDKKYYNVNFFDYHLPINGNDIIEEFGFKDKRIKTMLDEGMKIAYVLPNITKETCIKLLKHLIDKKLIEFD